MQPTVEEPKTTHRHYLRNTGIVLVVITVVVFVGTMMWAGVTQEWRFLTEARTTRVETNGIETIEVYHRTLWDWLDLLIIPVVLAGGAFWLNRSERRNEAKLAMQRAESDRQLAEKRAETDRNTAENRLQEEALQSYLDNMTQLLLERGLLKSNAKDDVKAVARVRTLTILRRLNGERKGLVVRFLYESELIQDEKDPQKPAVVNLASANLRMVYLRGANLNGIDLKRANLYSAELREIDLSEANLNEADLSKADMREARLSGADLSQANLSGANLKGADLSQANLNVAAYDDATQWPDGFDPVAAGAKKQVVGRRRSS